MQLDQLVKPIDQMTDEELRTHLRQVRQRREVTRPAAKKLLERSEAKTSRTKMSAAEKLLATLSPEELTKLLEQQEPST